MLSHGHFGLTVVAPLEARAGIQQRRYALAAVNQMQRHLEHDIRNAHPSIAELE